ncbi:MAG: XRE family transcriptional regulator [Anaerolineaceae bacterium]|nr:XRE family transcriptional regulator [Anaerolineaceae bacterium]
MKSANYRDQDYAFGQIMLTLRTAAGLTQADLAKAIGVSRRTVGSWETGSKYPKPSHLKSFITLGIEHRTFSPGSEADEIKALWKASNQKTLLDEHWLADVLYQRQPAVAAQLAPHRHEIAPVLAPVNVGPVLDWNDAPRAPNFYGRDWELKLLRGWIIEDGCRVISLLGLGGIGKSSLAVNLMHQVANRFEIIIWRSLQDIPDCDTLLDSLLQVIAPQMLGEVGTSMERRQSFLVGYMRTNRVLIVLDNVESVFEEGESTGRIRPGYEGIGRFLRQIAETEHHSCVMLTSREKPDVLVPHEGSHAPVRALRLSRLDASACDWLLSGKGVVGSTADRTRLIDAYAGNPLALKIVAQTIVELFDGEIMPFLEHGEFIFGGVRELLGAQFDRLSAMEQMVLLWLTILREPVTLDQMLRALVVPMPRMRLLEAVESLHRRSLIERGVHQGSFTPQSVVLEYVTARLIEEMVTELRSGQFKRLVEHVIVLAQAREYVRQNQERLIASPILNLLLSEFSRQTEVESYLLALLAKVADWPDDAQGYAAANLVTLLRLLRGDLRGLDLSKLVLRGVHLQGVDMQDVNLSGALIQDTVFSETFDIVTALDMRSDGMYWAASSRRGEIRIWEVSSQTLHLMWQAHTDMIWSLAFSPDGQSLATASWDGSVKVSDVTSGTLLWSGWHTGHGNRVAYSPEGATLASGGNDAFVRLWNARTGAPLQTIAHPDAITALAWSHDGRYMATGDLKGCVRVWSMHETEPVVCRLTLDDHTNCVEGLAFSPDSRFLASASWDRTVKLWDIANGKLHETLTAHSDRAFRVAWSPDGHLLATGSRDQTIWLWDMEQASYWAVLRGHTSAISGMVFTPDGTELVSGSEDGTLRVWDIANRHCSRVIQGYAASLYDVDWSPDNTHLVSSSTDYLVTIYAVNGETPPRVLRGHTGVVFGVGWSADGKWLASSEWDNAVRLWDPATGTGHHVLLDPDDPDNYFYGLTMSPDGRRLAGGTYRRGVLVWDLATQRQSWSGDEFPTWIRRVAWHPDGTRLAGGGDDATVYIFDAASGAIGQRLTRHHGVITSLTWNPSDEHLLASSGRGIHESEVVVWDAQRGERVASFGGHAGTINTVAWNQSGDMLVTGGGDGTLRWWNLESLACVRVRQGHEGTVQALRRSPDGTMLASAGDDGAIVLWDLYSGDLLQRLRRDRPYERLNIGGIRGLTEIQKEALYKLGAIEADSI